MGKSVPIITAALIALVVVIASPLTSSYGSFSGNQEYGATAHHDQDSPVNMTFESSASGTVSPHQLVTVWVNVTGEISGDALGALIASNTGDEGSLPTDNGWTIVSDPSGETQYNYYKEPAYNGSRSFSWTLAAPVEFGTYPIFAKVIHSGDGLFFKADGPIVFQVGETADRVKIEILQPSEGAVLEGNTTVTAFATVPSNILVSINSTDLLVDGDLVSAEYENPYTWVLDTRFYSNGEHEISVVAHDSLGQNHSDSVNVTIENGGEISGNLDLNIIAGITSAIALMALLVVAVLWAMQRRGG